MTSLFYIRFETLKSIIEMSVLYISEQCLKQNLILHLIARIIPATPSPPAVQPFCFRDPRWRAQTERKGDAWRKEGRKGKIKGERQGESVENGDFEKETASPTGLSTAESRGASRYSRDTPRPLPSEVYPLPLRLLVTSFYQHSSSKHSAQAQDSATFSTLAPLFILRLDASVCPCIHVQGVYSGSVYFLSRV